MAYNKSTIIIMLILPFIVFVLTLIPAVYEQYTNYTYFHGTDASGYGNICYRYRHTETRVFDVLSFLLFGTLCDILYAYLSVHILVSKLFKVIYIQSMQSMEKHDEEQNGSTLDTVEFHQKTRNSNKMVLIITKLVILLFIAVISTWTAIILLVFMGYWVYVIYSIDCCINIYCLWLNFEFSSKYYNKCFCGKQCIKLAFPTVKMLALTCTNCSDDDLNQCQKCGSCCCYCCKYCCAANKRQKQQNLYMMSKQETELMTL